MENRVGQYLRIQPGEYVVEQFAEGLPASSNADWLVMVRAPEGLTVVRRLAASEEAAGDRWVAFSSGQNAHGLDVPGMLAAVVNPLAQAGISVFVNSTYHADLVLVQFGRRHEAADVLRRAGHVVEDSLDAPP